MLFWLKSLSEEPKKTQKYTYQASAIRCTFAPNGPLTSLPKNYVGCLFGVHIKGGDGGGWPRDPGRHLLVSELQLEEACLTIEHDYLTQGNNLSTFCRI